MLRQQRESYTSGTAAGEDSGRNVPWLALWHGLQGENWHRNHHARPGAAPLGQTAGQTVLHRLSPLCARVAEESLSLTAENIGACALGLDLAAMRHETLPSRIFRS